MQSTGVPGPNMGPNWTPLARTVIVGFFALYVLQLLLRGTLEQYLAWQPGVKPLQLLLGQIRPGRIVGIGDDDDARSW